MGIRLLRRKYRAGSRPIVALMVCSLVHSAAFGSVALEQQPEKATQEKHEPKRTETPEKRNSEQAGDSQSQLAEANSSDEVANESGDGKPLASQINSVRNAEFRPMQSSWKPWGVKTQMPSADPRRVPSFSLYFMSEYRRDEIKYTGQPTLALQFPAPVPPFSVPDAPIFFVPSAFEPNDEQLVGYLSATVKDFGIGRLRMDTQVSLRYSGDLDRTTEASPFLGIRDNFVGRRILEPITFFADLRGISPDDWSTKLSLRVGRQYVYGATPLRVDGATISIDHPRFSLDLFGGRRVTFYSDPRERAVIGENFVYRASENTTIRYDFAHYIDNAHRLEVRHVLGESWILNGSLFLIDADPVDLNLGATYLSPGARTRVTMDFLQKLTDNDFIYDQSYRAVARNPENQFQFRFFPLPPTGQLFDAAGRLNLGRIDPYTQFHVDGYRNLTSKIGVGGTVWVRKVNSRADEGPFDNSFQELRANADYYPSAAFECGTEYRYRHLSRANPEQATMFDDISREGEKTFHEVYANSAYHVLDSRLTLEGGLFYRRFDTQSRLISLNGMDTIGYSAGVKWRVRNYKVALEYGFDRELSFLNPDIDNTQSFRVRFEWRFSR
ncbi:MAG TPA: hypothetical protein VLG74_09130 [Blastocatellia bacterium]|nr:hypothetical protein [Blastocatellia bacterium]